MTLYFTQTPHFGRRRWINRWMDSEPRETYSDVFIPVDVKVEDEAYVLTAVIPGVTTQDLNIQVVNETVTIQGEMKHDRGEDDRYLLSERPSGNFSRVLTMPDPLDAGKAEADISNGILTLRIPKAEDAKPKSIKVVAK